MFGVFLKALSILVNKMGQRLFSVPDTAQPPFIQLNSLSSQNKGTTSILPIGSNPWSAPPSKSWSRTVCDGDNWFSSKSLPGTNLTGCMLLSMHRLCCLLL